jgi:hypothetical protein
MIKLRKVFEANEGGDFETLEALVKAAIFDPVTEVREETVRALKKRYEGMIKKGFVGDNQVMVILQKEEGSPKSCLCL